MGKAAGCCGNFARLMLILFNFVFWLCGGVLVGIGVWVLVDPDLQGLMKFISKDEDNPLLQYASYVLIGVGGFAMVVGFLGCCGAIKLNRCILGIYAALVIIVIAGEIVGGVFAVVKENEIKEAIEEKSREFMYKKYDDKPKDQNDYVYAVDFVQLYFQCCGVRNHTGYKLSKLYNDTGRTLPWSCCEVKDSGRQENTFEKKEEHMEKCWRDIPKGQRTPSKWEIDSGSTETYGCKTALEAWVKKHSMTLYIIGFGIAGLEIFVVIFACCLMWRIDKEN